MAKRGDSIPGACGQGKTGGGTERRKELRSGSFGVFQYPEPFLLLLEKELFPFVKLVPGNTEAFTEALNGRTMEKSLSQDTQDKEKAIAGIGDNQIREDSMGVPAAITDQPEDSDFLHNGFPLDKVDDAAAIVSMDPAAQGGTADGAGFPLGPEGIHVGIK